MNLTTAKIGSIALPSARFVLLLLAFAAAAPGEVSLKSRFNPTILREGETGTFEVTVEKALTGGAGGMMRVGGLRIEVPRFPEVEGLEFRYLGPTRSSRIVNGRGTVTETRHYRVRAEAPGKYELPAFPITVDGEFVEVPGAGIEVIAAGTAADPGDDSAPPRLAWLELVLPRETLYVGEAVPTQLRLYFTSEVVDIRLAGKGLEHDGDSFIVGDFGKPVQRQIQREGEVLTEVVWEVLVTPLKNGPQPLDFDLDLVIATRGDRRVPRDPFESLFGSSMLGGFLERKEIRLTTAGREVTVERLPSDGRTENFTGGIGEFEVEGVSLSNDSVEAGEPLVLSVRISGKGNFERFEPPLLEEVPGWRSYPPESAFTPGDAIGHRGRKVFDFTIIPQREGIETTPGFTFQYFDPDRGEYVELPVPGLPLTVRASTTGYSAPTAANREGELQSRGPELLPQALTVGAPASALRPVFLSPSFLAAQGIAALGLGSLVVLRRRQLRHRGDPGFARGRRAKRETRRALAAARSAAARGDEDAFHEAARRALQEAVGPRIEGRPEALVGEDIDRLLETEGHPPEFRREVNDLFESGERLRYAGVRSENEAFGEALARTVSIVERLRDPR